VKIEHFEKEWLNFQSLRTSFTPKVLESKKKREFYVGKLSFDYKKSIRNQARVLLQ